MPHSSHTHTMNLEDDCLQPIKHEDLIYLIELYKKHLPSKILFYYHLKNRLNWIKETNFKASRCCIQIFTPKVGKLENGTFFSITDDNDCMINFCTLEESAQELTECFKKTKRINWNVSLWFEPILPIHSQLIYDCFEEGVPNKVYPCYYYWLPKKIGCELDISKVPEDVYLAQLNITNSELISSLNPHDYDGLKSYVENIIELNGGIGLYNKSTGNLLSWVLKNEHGGIGTLQTIESEYRKGYGKIVVKALIRQIAESNDDANVFILRDNFRSQKLFLDLGFLKIGESVGVSFPKFK